jgi:hypothetical protein
MVKPEAPSFKARPDNTFESQVAPFVASGQSCFGNTKLDGTSADQIVNKPVCHRTRTP